MLIIRFKFAKNQLLAVMITIKPLEFNLFSVNTYVISDETNECIIVDPGCNNPSEEQKLQDYISKKGLTPIALVITHYHIDHILGIEFVMNKWGLKPIAHKNGEAFWQNKRMGYEFGVESSKVVEPGTFIDEGDIIKFGNTELEVVYVPGHADGSICLINHSQGFVITGDVLFYGSIGRTDLPTGDFQLLTNGILAKLFSLNDNYVIYPGHGQKSVIGMEKLYNPYVGAN